MSFGPEFLRRMNAIARAGAAASGSSSARASAPWPRRSRMRSRSRTPSCPTSRRRACTATPARCSSARCPACRSRACRAASTSTRAATPARCAAPVRALKAAGAEALFVTNAAGSLNEEVGPGSLMAISDHINMLGVNPLTGPNDDAIGPRFPSLRDAYDPDLRARAAAPLRPHSAIPLAEGVYLATSGPELRDPGRDPRVPHARRGRRRHVDRPRGHPRPPLPACASSPSPRSPTSPRAWAARRCRTSRRCKYANEAAGDLTRLIIAFCRELAE